MRAPTPTKTSQVGRPDRASGDGEGKDVWMYFNNDLGGHAVRNALTLREFLA